MSYKIGIIGAARRHQGTGAFIARTFAHLGHEISGIIGTSESSTKQAVADLSSHYGISTQGYTNFYELIGQHALDIHPIFGDSGRHGKVLIIFNII